MTRTVLITGSAGHLGRALRAAFEAQGDRVIGIDRVLDGGSLVDWAFDLDSGLPVPSVIEADVLVANAKCHDWRAHHNLATRARQCVVNIGSIYGVLGNDPSMYEGTEIQPTPAWYAASKGALVALTKWQATNLAPVRSNAVLPGGIFRSHSDVFRTRYEAKVPLGRMAREEDVVPLVVFLASEQASYITGAIIPVDGGLSAW